MLAYDYIAGSPFQVTETIHTDQWDQWVQKRDEEQELAAYRDGMAMQNLLNDWSRVVPPGLFPGGNGDDGF